MCINMHVYVNVYTYIYIYIYVYMYIHTIVALDSPPGRHARPAPARPCRANSACLALPSTPLPACVHTHLTTNALPQDPKAQCAGWMKKT